MQIQSTSSQGLQQLLLRRMSESGGVGQGMNMPGMGMPSGQQVMQKADTDKSGGISMSEFKAFNPTKGTDKLAMAMQPSEAMQEQMFKGLDGDGNGQLSTAELDAGQQLQQDPMQMMFSMLGGGQSTDKAGGTQQDDFKKLLELIGNLAA